MKIDQYMGLTAKKCFQSADIEEIFENIRNNNTFTPKNNRKGNVFATRSNYGRQYKDIKEFTGLMFIDIDSCIDHKAVKEFFMSLEHTYATYFSSSGKNVHAIIKIPRCKSIDEYQSRFKSFTNAIEQYIDEIAEIDKITTIPTQLAFESYDPDLYINLEAIVYEGIEPKPTFKKTKYINNSPPTSSREEWVINWINMKIPYIVAPGYPQLLAHAKTLGGYISGGYINKETAEHNLETAVKNNTYFQSSESSGSMKTYLKSAIGSMEAGMNEPLCWED
jgi:hypothetical protein